MKYLFIFISFLFSIQLSLAKDKRLTIQSGNANLSIAKDGKSLSLQTGNTLYMSLNNPYVVTLEVNAETLNGYYSSVKEENESLICVAKLKSSHGTAFHVKDVFSSDTENHFRMDREITIGKIGKGDDYFNSYFGLTLQRETQIENFEFLFPASGTETI